MLRHHVCLAVLSCIFLCTVIALAQSTLETVKAAASSCVGKYRSGWPRYTVDLTGSGTVLTWITAVPWQQRSSMTRTR